MKYLFLLLLASVTLFSCKEIDKKFNHKSSRSYAESKKSLEEQERESPKDFLQLTGDDHRNFWGKYKDVRVKLLYFKEGVQVANHEELFDNAIAPNDDYTFKAKYKTPKGTDSVAAYIMSAKAVE